MIIEVLIETYDNASPLAPTANNNTFQTISILRQRLAGNNYIGAAYLHNSRDTSTINKKNSITGLDYLSN